MLPVVLLVLSFVSVPLGAKPVEGDHRALTAIFVKGNNSEWSFEARLSWRSHLLTSPCSALGVTCEDVEVGNNNTVAVRVTALDMSGFGLRFLPEDVGNLTALRSLTLSGSTLEPGRLTALPESLFGLASLEDLDLDGNAFTELPLGLAGMAGLRGLMVARNKLTALPPALPAGLTGLLFGGNAVASMPSVVATLANLTRLYANHNGMRGAVDLSMLCKLDSVDLSWNALDEWPVLCPSSSSMVFLDLTSNRIGSLAWLSTAAASRLRQVTVRDNKISTPLAGFAFACAAVIGSLDLSLNALSDLPADMCQFVQLKRLDVSSNSGIRSLPACLPPNLTFFAADGNAIEGLPAGIGALPLLTLDLSQNRLAALPRELANLTALESVNLASNLLLEIPEGFGAGFASLEKVDVSFNMLTRLPDSITNATGIKELVIAGNRLTSLPERIGSLLELKRLDLEGNSVRALPESFAELVLLERLAAPGNAMAYVPDLSPMYNLVTVNLASNNLTRFDCPPRLISLDLSANALVELGPSCGHSFLAKVDLSRNNLTTASGWIERMFFSESSSGGGGNFQFVSVDLSGNPRLFASDDAAAALKAVAVGCSGSVGLVTLSLADTGIDAAASAVFPSGTRFLALESADLSGNPLLRGGVGDMLEIAPRLVTLNLDGTGVTSVSPPSFPRLRFLSVRGCVRLVESRFDPRWQSLIQIDARGAFEELGPGVSSNITWTADGSPPEPDLRSPLVLDKQANSLCPQAIFAGSERDRFTVLVLPQRFRYIGCECLNNYFGTPSVMCLPCPARAVCADGTLRASGVWPVLRAGGEIALVPCLAGSAASGSPCLGTAIARPPTSSAEFETECARGHEGRLCAKCSAGYFSSSSRVCRPCAAHEVWAWAFPVLSLALVTVLGVKQVLARDAGKSGLTRTLVFHSQLLSALPDLSLHLPSSLSLGLSTASAGNGGLRFNGLECSALLRWDPVRSPFYVLGVAMPALVLVGAAYLIAVSRLVRLLGFKSSAGTLAADATTAACHLWVVLLFGSLRALLAPANCTAYGSSDHAKLFIVAAPWEPCPGPLMRAGALVTAAGYSLVSLALIGWVLARRPARLAAVFTAAFRPEASWWEVAQFSKAIAVAFVNRLAPFQSPLQPVLVSLVLALTLAAHCWVQPFKSPADNAFEMASLLVLAVTYATSLVFGNDEFRSSSGLAMAVLIVNVALLSALALTIFSAKAASFWSWCATTKPKKDPKQERLLQHGPH